MSHSRVRFCIWSFGWHSWILLLVSLLPQSIRRMYSTPIIDSLCSLSLYRSAVIVWVVYEMAIRREYIPTIRKELSNILETDPNTGKPTLTFASLRNAEFLDSFVREVMRMKGDTIAIFRLTTKDVPLGGYVIPKGTSTLLTTIISLTTGCRLSGYPARYPFPWEYRKLGRGRKQIYQWSLGRHRQNCREYQHVLLAFWAWTIRLSWPGSCNRRFDGCVCPAIRVLITFL